MLRGSIIHDYAYDYDGGEFSDLCERRMSGDQGPWELALYVLAAALAGVAWLTLVLGLPWQRSTKRVAALPGLATFALAGALPIGDAVFGPDGEILMILLLSIELSAGVALIAILVVNRTFTLALSCACWWCCGVRRPSVPAT
jgi:hypothetical protein